jgi:hypothetical protein
MQKEAYIKRNYMFTLVIRSYDLNISQKFMQESFAENSYR